MAGRRQGTRTGVGVVLFLLLAGVLVLYFSFHRVVVSGHSMDPTLHTGQRVWVSKAYWLVGPIRDKDIVVVEDSNPDGFIIKRVYKMGGETVDEFNIPKFWALTDGPYVVPKHNVYLIGDNREVSEDSRSFGPRDVSKVLGKVVIWP